jgi:hypothetical protein
MVGKESQRAAWFFGNLEYCKGLFKGWLDLMDWLNGKRCVRQLWAVVLATALAGCSGNLAGQLLQSGPSIGQPNAPINSLVAPPADTLQVANESEAQTNIEETDLGSNVPTLDELASQHLDGIDAPKVAASLEDDILKKKVGLQTAWRGKWSPDGLDLANTDGVLCSGDPHNASDGTAVRIACSDGAVGWLTTNGSRQSAMLSFEGRTPENVELLD